VEALRAAPEQDVAAILLDVQMPGMDGFETASLIRGRERSRHTPIIFLTALSKDLQHISRGYEAGAVDYLLKPFDPGVLRAKVRVFCDLERHRDAHRPRGRPARGGVRVRAGRARARRRLRAHPQANPALRRSRAATAGPARPLRRARCCGRPPGPRDLVAGLAAGAPRDAVAPVELHLVDLAGAAVPVAVIGGAVAGADGTASTIVLQVSDLRERNRAREAQQRLAAEREARAEAESLARRLRSVAAITDDLDRLAVAELVPELCGRLVRVLGVAGAAVVVLGEDGRVALSAEHGAGADPALLEAAVAAGGTPGGPPAGHGARALRVEDRVLGALAVSDGGEADPGQDAVLGHVAERVALIVERAGLHERERLIAATLQQDLLPDALPPWRASGSPPTSPRGPTGPRSAGTGTTPRASRRAAGHRRGDVAGRGVAAAARMGELRSVARAYAIEGHGPARSRGG
jgi:CheY-like chemotaxis protein